MRTLIETTCPICQSNHDVVVEVAALHKWQSGALIQDAFPMLSASERELLITGICDNCWPEEN
jgi:hypothetical protein